MSRREFAEVMAYLSAACGKPMPSEAAEVYFDLLGDLPVEVLRIAAKRVALSHPWATFPSVAELREAGAETMRGKSVELSAAEAWRIAWSTAGRIDLDVIGSCDRAMASVPPLVAEAMQSFGIAALCYGKEPVGVVRAQFVKFFEQLAAREKRVALLPPALRESIQLIGRKLSISHEKS